MVEPKDVYTILRKIKDDEITKEQGKLEMDKLFGQEIPLDKFDKINSDYLQELKLRKPYVQKSREKGDYLSDVQKMISYKGIIRPMTLNARNSRGDLYKLRVINIYVKPNAPKTEIVKNEKGGPQYDGHGKKVRKVIYETVKVDGKPVLDAEGNPMLKPVIRENTRIYEENVYKVSKADIRGGKPSDYYYPAKAMWSKKEDSAKQTKLSDYQRKKAKQNALKRLKRQKKTKCRCTKRR